MRADSFEVSFGSPTEFFSEYGRDGALYLDHLRSRMADQPGSCVHVYDADSLIGQVELRDGRKDPAEGYVNLYYLIPSRREAGLGSELDAYAIRWFRDRGMTAAALGVSRTKARALHFYEKMGWTRVGPHPKGDQAILMRKKLVWPHAA